MTVPYFYFLGCVYEGSFLGKIVQFITPITQQFDMYFEQPHNKPKRPIINKLQPSSKLLISTIVAIIGFIVTHGQPKKANTLIGVDYVDTSVEYIFQTTIAVEKQRFIKRIVVESNGIWQYIPYANHDKWADLQITLTTRIGFDIKNTNQVNAGITPQGKLRVDVFEPTILSKHWQTKIVDSSDHYFAKWDIKQFKEKEAELLQALTTEESMQILDSFRNDANKMSELAYRLDQKLLMRKETNFSPLYWFNNVNRMITNKLDQFSKSFALTSNNSKPEYFKKQSSQGSKNQQQSSRSKSTASSSGSKGGQNSRNNRRVSSYKQISFSQQEDKIRRQMKNQLNL